MSEGERKWELHKSSHGGYFLQEDWNSWEEWRVDIFSDTLLFIIWKYQIIYIVTEKFLKGIYLIDKVNMWKNDSRTHELKMISVD